MKSFASIFVLFFIAASGCDGSPTESDPGSLELGLELVAEGFSPFPTFIGAPPADDRLFVLERDGQIRIVDDGTVLSEPFLDIQDRASTFGEGGAFSFAFHPHFATNRFVYVNFAEDGMLKVVRFTANSDATRADVSSAKTILEAGPAAYHFGGTLAFGPDGMLFVSIGEGVGGGNAQDKSTLLGSIVRIDVDSGDPYAIPPDNPFVGESGGRGEIWAMGLRNPWRMTIDAESETLFIGDVGGNYWEEVDIAPLSQPGLNFGWPQMEGALCHPELTEGCSRPGFTNPILAYPHGDRGTGHPFGCSITGGPVYRGEQMPSLRGHYFYGDFCQGWVRSFRVDDGEVVDPTEWSFGQLAGIVTFGVDGDGEVYVGSASGSVYRLVPTSGE